MGDFFTSLKGKGKLFKICLILGLGLILILFSSLSRGDESNENRALTLDEYRERLEGEVSDLCSDVAGVGRCKVFITFKRGEQNVYKGSVLLETKPPEVLGVTVICRGGDSDIVRHELTEMLTSLFGIGSNRVAILKLN